MPILREACQAIADYAAINLDDVRLYARYLVTDRVLPRSRGRAHAELNSDHVALLVLALMASESALGAPSRAVEFANMKEGGDSKAADLGDTLAELLEDGPVYGPADQKALLQGELIVERRARRAILRLRGRPDAQFWSPDSPPKDFELGGAFQVSAHLGGDRLWEIGRALFGPRVAVGKVGS